MANLLFEAVNNNDLDRVRFLIESYVVTNADILEKDEYGNTTLHIATFKGNFEIVKLLIESGSNVLEKGNFYWGNLLLPLRVTPLHLASQIGYFDIVKLLVEAGMSNDNTNVLENVLEKNNYDQTALHLASNKGHFDIVKFLVESGSDIDIADSNGNTTIDLAKTKEIEEYLMEQLEIQKNGGYVLK